MFANVLFGAADGANAAVWVAVVGVVGQLILWITGRLDRRANRNDLTKQTGELKTVVQDEVKPVSDKATRIEVQTNGISHKLEAKSSALAECLVLLEATTKRLKLYEANQPEVRIAEETIAKLKSHH